MAHAVAVAADRNDVAVVKEPVDERGRHDVVAEDLATVLEALVGGEDGGGGFIAAGHGWKEISKPAKVFTAGSRLLRMAA